jgi:enoyl-CoA hydratase/carnithine racemase
MTAGLPDLVRAGLRFDVGAPAPGAATITLDRSQRRNAMTPGMWHGLAGIGQALPPDVRVVVVQGAGPSFSAGIDLRLFTPEGVPGEVLVGAADPGFEDWIASVQAGFTWLRDPGIVSVAAVRGHAIGAGFQLALSCDLRVLADDAQLCMKEPALGLVPDLTGTKPLVDIVGLPRALELCLTSRTVGAAEAAALRLAERWCPARSWMPRSVTWWRRCSRWSPRWPGPRRNSSSRPRAVPWSSSPPRSAGRRPPCSACVSGSSALLARGRPRANRAFALS